MSDMRELGPGRTIQTIVYDNKRNFCYICDFYSFTPPTPAPNLERQIHLHKTYFGLFTYYGPVECRAGENSKSWAILEPHAE